MGKVKQKQKITNSLLNGIAKGNNMTRSINNSQLTGESPESSRTSDYPANMLY